MEQQQVRPDYIFETSWEVCNKVGGIYTVITTKTLTLVNEWGDHLIMIGPDIWKGTGENPEFTEDKNLFPSWRANAASKGLKIKIGRWKITGNPIVILVDFTPFFTKKDEILSELWIRYKVDSLTGGWDYIEPALFGYASAKVIESFYHHHLTFSDKIVAQFHEWITGVGLLYLNEHIPQIGTVFTTHATVVGRSIAGNGMPLYSKFNSYNPEQEARNFNVVAKHSLEKMAAFNADCFTTVSEITAKECVQFLEKKPDVITPNGFEDFIVPDSFFFKEKRNLARKKLLQVAGALFGYELPSDSLLLIKSGRYEFHNKGVDIFIDALGILSNYTDFKKEIITFIFIPAHNTGPRKDLEERIENGNYDEGNKDKILTHYLQGAENDPILLRIKQNQLDNNKQKKVKVVFAPVYMNGSDGIFNMNYYELLVGFDLSAFPSYYEPWGYTPLESLAFHIPTVTTNLTGFGMIVHKKPVNISDGIAVIERDDNNDEEAKKNIASIIKEYSDKNEDEIKTACEAAFQLSKTALWKNFIEYYKSAYSVALKKAAGRAHRYRHEAGIQVVESLTEMQFPRVTEPLWRKIFVQYHLPENLSSLDKLAKNLWWTWNMEATQLFEMIDSELWEQLHHNPILLLNALPYIKVKRLEKNKEFISRLNTVNEKFDEYLNRKIPSSPLVAYFCMEYGLWSNIKLYSGGLGILAGDYLKEASDSGLNLVGIGLLYRNGYFKQGISTHGEQVMLEEVQKFTSLPLLPVYDKDKNWVKIGIAFPGRTLYAKIWKVEVGTVSLYLMDTDIPENQVDDRTITGNLYGGDQENRLKQELLLGIGGVRLLNILGIYPDVYHYNEGHAAFAGLERLLTIVQEENVSFDIALEVVRGSSLFTTHTPVPAGHDAFNEEILRAYLSYHANLLNISWKRLLGLGKTDENNQEEKFSMSFLAARLSQEVNGVSMLHEKVSRKMFQHLWKGYGYEELHIGHVTNGVHGPSWISSEWQQLYKKYLGNDFADKIREPGYWNKIDAVTDKAIWKIHTNCKKVLLNEIRKKRRNEKGFQNRASKEYLQQISSIDENALIIGFARRFVPYKRSELLFYNPEKLSSIIKKSKYPVLFVFAGKAHPQDNEGQNAISRIIEISKQKEMSGHVLFLQNYDIELAKHLVSGVDIWLNTPVIEMEASGTSGMKAALNGVINCSVIDGWWAEAYKLKTGWTIPHSYFNGNDEDKNEIDSEALYEIVENEIIPLYSERNKDDIPVKWVSKIKNSIEQIAPRFNTQRMIREYEAKYYDKLASRNMVMRKNNFEAAKQISDWKHKILNEWNTLRVISMEVYDSANKTFPLGANLTPSITLDLGNLTIYDIGVEIIFLDKKVHKIIFKHELKTTEVNEKQVTYSCKIPLTQSGVYEYGFRIYPKNPLLPHRQDFRW